MQRYYDTLGIRPTAGREEIELAYKGRRSQYHPDRYAQSDADTQAWATKMMQQVNEAYQALTNPELRAGTDQGPSFRDVAAILLQPKWEWFHDRVYARPGIPRKKLEGAIASYATGVSPEDVIVLLDDTVFGGAKEGLLVTNDAIYCKQKFEEPRRKSFDAVREVAPGTDSRILVNGVEFFKANVIEHLAMGTFASRLSHVFKAPTGADDRPGPRQGHESSGVDKLWILHRGAMTALRLEREGQTFQLDELIDRQMWCVADKYALLEEACARRNRSGRGTGSVEAECAEGALIFFLLLHYYGFSTLPDEVKEGMGTRFVRLHESSETYKLAFREGFPVIYGRPFNWDSELEQMLSAMFIDRHGRGDFETRLPREEVLLSMFVEMGFPGDAAKALMRRSEHDAGSWLEMLLAAIPD